LPRTGVARSKVLEREAFRPPGLRLLKMRPAVLCLLVAVALPACDLPTQFPRYDTSWDVVVIRDSISTDDLLPDDLRTAPEGFVIDRYSVEGEVLLGDVCELCTCFQGPIPPLEIAPHDWRVPLPPGLISATLESGSARVTVFNQVGFDILDDGAGGRGFLAVDLTDTRDGRVLAQAVVAQSFPPGDSVRLSFDLSGMVLSPYLVARIRGFMPGSACRVELTAESGFRARVELDRVVASSVEVWVSDQALRLPERSFGLPSFVSSRLRPGEATLTLEVEVETRLPADVEIGVSAAGRRQDLFTGQAALYTPLVIPEGTPQLARSVRRLYVVRLDPLHDADRLYVDTRNRFLGSKPMVLRGGESVSYRVRLRAEVPSR